MHSQTRYTGIVKIGLSIFMMILIPLYLSYYGWYNFLWLSDVGLFMTLAALWSSSSFLMSIPLVIVFPVEIMWNIDFFIRLLTGYKVAGLTNYMFDDTLPLFLRCLSLFHVAMPLLWGWYLFTWGYNRKAFIWAMMLFWLIMVITYWYTPVEENINWVFAARVYQWQDVSPAVWLVILMIGFPLFVFLPMHLVLMKFFDYTKRAT